MNRGSMLLGNKQFSESMREGVEKAGILVTVALVISVVALVVAAVALTIARKASA